ncbi:MAG: hypothetical protein HW387_143 [Parachlamydiales bacterium]|nr:hypothetical protein [Parachlamydiales bacterium]
MIKKTILTVLLGSTAAFAEFSQSASTDDLLRSELSTYPAQASEIKRTSQVSFDVHFSPFAGSQNILALHQGFERLENAFFPTPKMTLDDLKKLEQSALLSSSSQWGRWSRNLFYWLPLNVTFLMTQHEIFGHGYRIRDLGSKYGKVTGYSVHGFGAVTEFDPTPLMTSSQMLTIAIAGCEAEAIMANQVRMRWLGQQFIDPRQAPLYSGGTLGLMGYTLSVRKTPTSAPRDGNDMKNYLFYLNATYPDAHLSGRSLRNQAMLNLLDPFLFLSMMSELNYIKTGLPSAIPMISLGGGVKYLPALRFGLTPFGPQYYLENFFLKGSIPTHVYLKWGRHGANTYYGLGLENRNMFTWKNASIGVKMDIWHQPNVLFKGGALTLDQMMDVPLPPLYSAEVLSEKRFGAAGAVVGSYELPDSLAELNLELGYKTKGYLPGEALRQSPILRGGFSLSF